MNLEIATRLVGLRKANKLSQEALAEKLESIHEEAYTKLGIHREVEPVMTLCFMSLAVIPEIKLTDMGLFDVTEFRFIEVEA